MALILETVDENAAHTVTALILKLSQAAAGQEIHPKAQQIKGQSVLTLPINPHYSVAYGRVGNTVVVGPYAEGVAQALADGASKGGLASDTEVMTQLEPFKNPIGVVVLRPGSLAFSSFGLSGYRSTTRSPAAAGREGKERRDKAERRQPKITTFIQKDSPEKLMIRNRLLALLAREPRLVIGVTRGPDFLMREAKSSGWDRFVPRIVNFVAETMAHSSSRPGRDPGSTPPATESKPLKRANDKE
jgi:hypothetical protein